MQKEKKLSAFAILSLLAFAIAFSIYLLSCASVHAADFFNSTLCHEFRKLMAAFGDIFPFSLIEVLVLSLPLIVAAVVYFAVRAFSRGRALRFVINLLAFILLVYSGHLIALGIGYRTTPVSERMGIEEREVNADSLAEVMEGLINEVNTLAPIVKRDSEGVFVSGYDYDDLSRVICDSYADFYEKYGFPESFYSRAKGVRNGNLMSYLEITGIYTYITGEANVNTAFPAYDTIFTTAHELAHQRGIMRENEASFVGYVVCATSPDEALRYSAALTMYEYIASALYGTDKESYSALAPALCEEARVDMRASRAVIDRYSDTFIGRLSNRVNDIFLKSNGTEGVVSYSRVVELVVSYYGVE